MKFLPRLHHLYAVCFFCIVLAYYITREAGVALQISIIALGVPALLQVSSKQLDWRLLKMLQPVVLSFSVALLGSVGASAPSIAEVDTLKSIVAPINLIFSLSVLAVIVAHQNTAFIKKVMATSAFFISFLVIYALMTDTVWAHGTRAIIGGIQPNWWGMLSFGTVAAAFLSGRKLAISVALCCGAVVMVACSARGAMLATLTMLFTLCYRGLFNWNHALSTSLLAALVFSICGILVLADPSYYVDIRETSYNALDSIFLLSDSYRGLGSGMTGRTDLYPVAIEAWAKSPIFGNGLGSFGDIHNGFLILLAEGGILLFSVFAYWTWAAIINAKSSPSVLGSLIGYLVLMMTYPRSLNLHFTSLVFLLSILVSIASAKRLLLNAVGLANLTPSRQGPAKAGR